MILADIAIKTIEYGTTPSLNIAFVIFQGYALSFAVYWLGFQSTVFRKSVDNVSR